MDGVQFVTQYLAEGLNQKGHHVTVVTNFYQELTKAFEEEYHGVVIKRFEMGTKHTFHYGDKKAYVAMIKELAGQNDIMVNVCTQCAPTDFLLDSLDEIKIPKVLYLHSMMDFQYHKDDFKTCKAFARKIFENVRWKIYYHHNKHNFLKYDIVTQLHEKDYATDFFLQQYGIHSAIMENAAEDSFFDDSVDDSVVVPQKYLINVSNYLERKNQEKGMELFLKANISPECELLFIGSGKNAYYEHLTQKYAKYCQNNPNAKKVRFLYGIPRNQIATYVKKASAYLMTSRWEAFPISLVESMAAGTPFISSDVGIVKYLSGGKVCHTDAEMIQWIEKLMTDDTTNQALGNAGKTEAQKRYSIHDKVDAFEKLLIELQNQKKEKK